MAWERVIESAGSVPTVLRSAVPGGWLYASHNSMVFVPEPNKVSEQHDDAWERGHKAGWMQAKADTIAQADEPMETRVNAKMKQLGEALAEEPVNPHDSEQVARTFRRFKTVDHLKQAYQLNLEAERTYEGDKVKQDELGKAYAQGFNDGLSGGDTSSYPKYLVIGLHHGQTVCMTHGLFDTNEQAAAYAAQCHSAYNATVLELAKPLYVREGE